MSKFEDIEFPLTKKNMINVMAREIEFMITVLDNDLSQENVKLRSDAEVYRMEKGDNTLIITAGKCMSSSSHRLVKYIQILIFI